MPERMIVTVIALPASLLRRVKQHAQAAQMRSSELMSLWIAKAELDCRARLLAAERSKICEQDLCPKCQELMVDDFFFHWCEDCQAGSVNQEVKIVNNDG